METTTTLLTDAAALFGVVIALAVLVLGFVIGRKLVRRALRDEGGGSGPDADERFLFQSGGIGYGWNEYRSYGGKSYNTGQGSGLHRGRH